MTRADFYDWVIAHDCEVEKLNTHRVANSIKIFNKHGHVYLDLPIDNKPMKEYYVCKACMVWLNIPLPDFCKDSEKLAAEIKERHYPNAK